MLVFTIIMIFSLLITLGTSVEDRIVGRNKKAFHRYTLTTRFEAGLILRGSEVKSLRGGMVSFEDAHAVIRNGEIFLRSLHISPYSNSLEGGHNPTAERKLLLKSGEIKKIETRVLEKGMTLIPTMVYFKNGWAKVELALASGKRQYDKRQVIMERDQKRELARIHKQVKQFTGK